MNEELFDNLSDLVQLPFFRYFQVRILYTRCPDVVMFLQADLYRECPFWIDNGFCSNPGCSITTVDEVSSTSVQDYMILKVCKSDIPEKWRAKALSKVDPASIDKVCFVHDDPSFSSFDHYLAACFAWLLLPRFRFLFFG